MRLPVWRVLVTTGNVLSTELMHEACHKNSSELLASAIIDMDNYAASTLASIASIAYTKWRETPSNDKFTENFSV